jgi:hypothetical protein
MWTVENITDEQIGDLWESCLEVREDGGRYYRSEEHHQIQITCNVATNGFASAEMARVARARCAEILNARNAKETP